MTQGVPEAACRVEIESDLMRRRFQNKEHSAVGQERHEVLLLRTTKRSSREPQPVLVVAGHGCCFRKKSAADRGM